MKKKLQKPSQYPINLKPTIDDSKDGTMAAQTVARPKFRTEALQARIAHKMIHIFGNLK